jgi:hypothetical protein
MITEEQARAAFEADEPYMEDRREKRILTIAPCDMSNVFLFGDNNLGADTEDAGWKVVYEYRDKKFDGSWWHWQETTKYIVEAKPGPYVVE